MSLRSSDPAAFDAAADQVPSVIDALVATIDATRRDRFENWLAPPINMGVMPRWLAGEGEEAGWIVAAHARAGVAGRSRWGNQFPYDELGARSWLATVLETFPGRPASHWLWAEVFGAIPADQRQTASRALSLRASLTHHNAAPIKKLLRARTTFRGLLFQELDRAGELDVDDALAGLADPSSRKISEAFLRDHVAEVAGELRGALSSATTGQREAIVRLLRRIDPRLGADGKTGPADLGDLEAALRAHPWDLETSRIWADLLMDRGDPRGQLASFTHAMIGASPERALELSDQLATLTATHRKTLLGKPGGFPFREKYLGRSCIAFHSTWRAMMRGKPAKIVERVHDFLVRVTDLEPPAEVSSGKLEYTFKLAWPDTKLRLPFQEDGHYPTPFGSSISVELDSGKLVLGLAFPFESFNDPDLHRVYDAIAETLTKVVLTPTGFSACTPTADGKKLKFKRSRFMR